MVAVVVIISPGMILCLQRVQFLVAHTRLCHSLGPSFPLQAAFALLPLPNHIPLMLLCIQHPLALPPTTPTSQALPKGGSLLLSNCMQVVFALLPLPNHMRLMLSCIQYPTCPACEVYTTPWLGRYAEEKQKLSKIAPIVNFSFKIDVQGHFFKTFWRYFQ